MSSFASRLRNSLCVCVDLSDKGLGEAVILNKVGVL